MPPNTVKRKHTHSNIKRSGFTLLEVIVAMVVLVIAMSLIFQVFAGATQAWKRGNEVLDGIKHGDFAMNQLNSALNSTIYFYNANKSYAFIIEKNNHAGLPADTLDFVTASEAFMPQSSKLKDGPHRIRIYIDTDKRGRPALFSRAIPALANFEDYEAEFDTKEHLVAQNVHGLEVLIYDKETEDWTEEWEEDNSVPERIKVIVYIASDDKKEKPLTFTRLIEIPVSKSVKYKLTGPSRPNTKDNRSNPNTAGNSFNKNKSQNIVIKPKQEK